MQFTVIDGVLSSVSNADIKDDGSFVIPEGVIAIGKRAFENCTRLKTLTIPEGVISIGEGAFGNCRGLQKLTIPKGVTSIGDWAFGNCSGLQELIIPEGVTSIGNWAFGDCSGLQELTIPEGVASIGVGAFCKCSGLQTLTIPKGVTSIGECIFYQCIGLQTLIIPEDFPNTVSFVFDDCPNINSIVIYSMNDDAIKRIINLVPEDLRSKITPPELVKEALQWMKEELSRVARTPEINPLYPFNKAISVKYSAISDDTLNEISSYLLNDLIYYRNAQKLMQSVPLPKEAGELSTYKDKLSRIANEVISKAVLSQLGYSRDRTLAFSYSFFKTDTAQKITGLETMIDEEAKAQPSLLS